MPAGDDDQINDLCQRLCSTNQYEKTVALRTLAERDFTKQQAANCRLAGACKHVVEALDSTTSGLDVAAQLHVLVLVEKWCAADVQCKDHLVKLGLIRKLSILLFTDDMAVIHQTLLALVPLTYTGDLTHRNMDTVKSSFEELFRSGAASRMIRFLELSTARSHRDVTLQSIINITYLADVPWYRERLRDLGLIPLAIALVRADPDEWEYVANVYNMSRAESVHLSLKEHGVLQVLQEVINGSSKEVIKLLGLITVANIYGGEESNDPCQALLSAHDVSRLVIQMLDSTKDGDGLYRDIPFGTEESVSAVRSLARNTTSAESLVANGALPLLLEVLGNGKHSKAVYVQVCHALGNLARVKALQQGILEAGVAEAVQRFEADPEVRLADAAKAVLLMLSKVKDAAVLEAAAAMQGTDEDFAQSYDVFLSHKRTDSKDFARALYNLLVTRGIRTFLDFEYREELKDLGKIVANCHNLVFILTDNIFDSHWCMEELQAAVDNSVNIILVVKEGSRWKDTNGNKVCEFPPYELINTLSSGIQQVFTRKAITHSDEYYQAFVDNMIKKIQIPVRPAAAATTAEPAARPQPLPTTTAGCLHAPTPQQVQPPPTHQQLHPDPHHPVAVGTADSHSLHLPLQQQQNSAGGLAFGGTPPHMLHATATAAGAFPFVPYGYPAAAVHAVHAAAPMGTAMSHHHDVGALGRDITAEVRQLGREISLELQQLQQAQTAGAQLSARSLSQELLQHNSTVVALLQSQQQVMWGLKERVVSLEGAMAQLACSVNTLLANAATAGPWGPVQQQRSSYTSLGLGLGLGLGPVAAAGGGALLPPSLLSQSQIGSEASDFSSGPLPHSDRAAALASVGPPSGGSGGSGGWSGGASRPSKVAANAAGGLGPPSAAHTLQNHHLHSGQGHGQGQGQRRSSTTLEAGLPPLMARGRGAY